MAKSNTLNYVLTFRLKPEKWQQDKLNILFEVARKIYNCHLRECYRRWNKMRCDPEWSQYKHLDFKNKDRKKIYGKKLKEFGLNNWQVLNGFNKKMRQYYGSVIPSQAAVKISKKAYETFNKCVLFGNKRIHWAKKFYYNSVESASNSGIQFKDNKIIYHTRNMKTKVIISIDKKQLNDEYNQKAIEKDKVKYVRLKREQHKGKWIYYAQTIMEGLPPKLPVIGKGKVGIDIGPSTVAYVSNDKASLQVLAPSVKNIEKQISYLQRKLDRSRRSNNPSNYNEDGTINTGQVRKNGWNYSIHYKKILSKLHDLQRKNKNVRKIDHEILADEIISHGDEVYEETMRWKSLAKRTKKTEINEKTGRNKSKSRFGKSINNHAPSLLNSLISQKLGYYGKLFKEINTYKAKASQYHHDTDEFVKDDSKLSKRWKIINGERIQRDLYSAFLIQHINNNLDKIDKDACGCDYDQFKKVHDVEINRLKLSDERKPVSMGIN